MFVVVPASRRHRRPVLPRLLAGRTDRRGTAARLFARVLACRRIFERARTGDILSRLTADIAVLQTLVGSAISMGARNVLTRSALRDADRSPVPKLAGIIAVILRWWSGR